MNEIARTVINKYSETAKERGVKLRLPQTINLNLPPVLGDAKYLERALMALVDNAIKFSPRGGEVRIHVDKKDDKVLISVEDHGIGIAKENLPRIFDRFYHLEKSGDDLFGGIGLGLAITRQVLKQHHGSLDVISKPGKGSTFTMTLKQWR
jgi:two-component system phosphate regulon sensor histidine kinase PhoR